MRRFTVLCFLILAGCTSIASASDDRSEELAESGMKIFKERCVKCHNAKKQSGEVNLLDRESLLKNEKVQPGKPDESDIIALIESGEMPKKAAALDGEEKKAIRDWVAAGFTFPGKDLKPKPVEAKADGIVGWADTKQTLRLIHDHLDELPVRDRPFYRYFTFANIKNRLLLEGDKPDEARAAEGLKIYHAALSKTLNSLSWEKDIYLPEDLEDKGIVLAVDLRWLNWDDSLWRKLFCTSSSDKNNPRPTTYPYSLDYEGAVKNGGVAELAKKIKELTTFKDRAGASTPLLFVRADWFIANATRPPLYPIALDLPETVGELEKKLDVDVVENLKERPGIRVIRAGFNGSGISHFNRVVERHSMMFGAYWKSYDFDGNEGDKDILTHPLGPDFPDHPAEGLVFRHAGGEMIFSLPNGLQGYYLSDASGKRLDVAPTKIVSNKNEGLLNSVEVTNGLSCMSCHKNGMIGGFKDIVQKNADFGKGTDDMLKALYADPKVMRERLNEDTARFLKALESVVGRFVEDQAKVVDVEPITFAVTKHREPLTIKDIAAEIGDGDIESLKQKLAALDHFENRVDDSIERSQWESASAGGADKDSPSLYQELHESLKIADQKLLPGIHRVGR